jgi:hypothetical protein
MASTAKKKLEIPYLRGELGKLPYVQGVLDEIQGYRDHVEVTQDANKHSDDDVVPSGVVPPMFAGTYAESYAALDEAEQDLGRRYPKVIEALGEMVDAA